MEAIGWTSDDKYRDIYFKIMKHSNTYYKVEMEVEYDDKMVRVWVSAASGRKRKHLNDFDINDYRRDGGIKALVWIKNEIMSIPESIKELYTFDKERMYICIGWVDNHRRNVYSRLEREGFVFMVDRGLKILRKRIN